MYSVYRINSVSILLDCYIICTLAKSRDRAGSGTGPGTSFPFKTSKGNMPSALEAIPTGLIKELVIANFIWRCIDRACTERFQTVRIKGNTTPRGNQEHTHAPKPEEPIARSVVESMKSAARETTRHFPEIYEALAVQASQLHPGMAGSLPLVSTLSTFCSGQGERLILYFSKMLVAYCIFSCTWLIVHCQFDLPLVNVNNIAIREVSPTVTFLY